MKLRALEFRCPKCGSAEWGSVGNAALGGPLVRFCHGTPYDPRQDCYVSCRFSWPEADDWRWFVARFADAESYEIASLATRPGPVVVATSVAPPVRLADVVPLVMPARAGNTRRLESLRAHGHEAHLHPTTGRVAVWFHGAWWDVMGGSFEHPSLMRSKEQPGGPLG